MDELFWITGLFAWVGVGLYVAALLSHAAWCVVVAIDLLLWARRCAHAEGQKWRWWQPAGFVARNSWRFIVDVDGYSGTSFKRPSGRWDGFRDGKLYVDYRRPAV